jgi:hypothetical protein
MTEEQQKALEAEEELRLVFEADQARLAKEKAAKEALEAAERDAFKAKIAATQERLEAAKGVAAEKQTAYTDTRRGPQWVQKASPMNLRPHVREAYSEAQKAQKVADDLQEEVDALKKQHADLMADGKKPVVSFPDERQPNFLTRGAQGAWNRGVQGKNRLKKLVEDHPYESAAVGATAVAAGTAYATGTMPDAATMWATCSAAAGAVSGACGRLFTGAASTVHVPDVVEPVADVVVQECSTAPVPSAHGSMARAW